MCRKGGVRCPSIANVIKAKSSETGMLAKIPEDARTGDLHRLILNKNGKGKDVAGAGLSLIESLGAVATFGFSSSEAPESFTGSGN